MIRLMKHALYVILASSLILINAILIIGLILDRNEAKMRSIDIRETSTETSANAPSPADEDEANADTDEAGDKIADEEEVSRRPESALLDIASLRQHPELYNGCEITTLTMLLNYRGFSKSKLEFTRELAHDPAPLVVDARGNVVSWGDPHVGFVGDITGKQKGLGVYHGPILDLMKEYIPSAVNLTNEPFDILEYYVSEGRPVIVWTTVSFQVPAAHQWFEYDSPTGAVRATFQMHTVLMVGYDEEYVYVNEPQTGEKAKKINKEAFIKTWEVMGKQALSYT